MTPQEVFDKVLNHLRTTPGQSRDGGPYSNGCMYHMHAEGYHLMCAAGIFIPKTSKAATEIGPIDEILFDFRRTKWAKAIMPHVGLLLMLQRVHDNSTHWDGIHAFRNVGRTFNEDGERELAKIAEAHGLTYTAPKD